MGARAVLRCIGVAAPLWLAAIAVPGAGVAAEDGPANGPAASAPELPRPAGRIGRVKRDESGRIVPIGPPLPPEDNRRGGLFAPHQADGAGGARYIPTPPPIPQISSFDPRILDAVRSRADHDMQARRMQLDIDVIAREEAEAKARGAPVNRNGRTAREESLLAELERIDREVQEHEMQHYFAGQPWARFPEYFYITGPNGRRYAMSGITPFDATALDGDMPATVQKLETLIRAALAPREPSEEDRRVAAALEQLVAILRRQAGGPP